jgi:cellobiose transport system permease protein
VTTDLARADVRAPQNLTFAQKASRWDVKYAPYLYISPFFLLFALVGLFPLIYTGYVSLHNWNLVQGDQGFVAFDNFRFVLNQPRFGVALRNTFSIFLLSSVPQMILAILIAAVLDANLKAKTFWRMGVLLPYVVAPIAVSLIFGQIFADHSGALNAALTQFGLPAVTWHSDVLASHLAIATMVNFRWTGYNTLIFLAAMQAIPREVIEAAVVDGATRVKTFLQIVVPMLRPTIIFVVITSTIGGLQIFDEPRMFDTAGLGGSDRQWMTITMYLYELGWGSQRNLGRAAAVAWILFLIIVVIAVLNYVITGRIATSGGPKQRRKARR